MGEEHRLVARTRSFIGQALLELGDTYSAEDNFREALRITEVAEGGDALFVATCCDNLARALMQRVDPAARRLVTDATKPPAARRSRLLRASKGAGSNGAGRTPDRRKGLRKGLRGGEGGTGTRTSAGATVGGRRSRSSRRGSRRSSLRSSSVSSLPSPAPSPSSLPPLQRRGSVSSHMSGASGMTGISLCTVEPESAGEESGGEQEHPPPLKLLTPSVASSVVSVDTHSIDTGLPSSRSLASSVASSLPSAPRTHSFATADPPLKHDLRDASLETRLLVERLLNRALTVRAQHLPDDHPDVLESRTNLAAAMCAMSALNRSGRVKTMGIREAKRFIRASTHRLKRQKNRPPGLRQEGSTGAVARGSQPSSAVATSSQVSTATATSTAGTARVADGAVSHVSARKPPKPRSTSKRKPRVKLGGSRKKAAAVQSPLAQKVPRPAGRTGKTRGNGGNKVKRRPQVS